MIMYPLYWRNRMEDKQIIDKQQKVINKLVDAKKRVEEHLRDVDKVMLVMHKNERCYNYLLTTLINGLNNITNKQRRVVIKNISIKIISINS